MRIFGRTRPVDLEEWLYLYVELMTDALTEIYKIDERLSREKKQRGSYRPSIILELQAVIDGTYGDALFNPVTSAENPVDACREHSKDKTLLNEYGLKKPVDANNIKQVIENIIVSKEFIDYILRDVMEAWYQDEEDFDDEEDSDCDEDEDASPSA